MKRLWTLGLCVFFVSIAFVACGGDNGTTAPVQAVAVDEQSSSSENVFVPSFILPDLSSSSAMTIWDYMDLLSSSSVITGPTMEDMMRWTEYMSSSSLEVDDENAIVWGSIKYYKNEYKTVRVGGVTWMAENINEEVPMGSSCYNNDPTMCAKYGMLYNSLAAHEVCRYLSGWHLPDNAEWEKLISMQDILNADGGLFHFCDLGGYMDKYGNFDRKGHEGFCWSASTISDEIRGGYTYNYYVNQAFVMGESIVQMGNAADKLFSVRCVQD